jgi:hypothetical protein
MVLEELGLEEEKLYKISKKEYLDNHPELKQEKAEIQDKRYEHYEKRRQEAIDQARQIRTEIINKEKESGNEGEGVKNDSKNDNMKNEAKQSGMIKKELEKLELIKKQQLSEIKNLIDYEYTLNETRKKMSRKKKKKEKRKKE